MFKKIIARILVNRQRKRYPVEYLEQKHVDLKLPFPNDSSFFYGGDKAGNAFITRMAFRDPARGHEYWFDFYIKGLGFIGLKEDPGPDGEGFQMGNLKWEPIEVGKSWRITYNGPLTDEKGKKYEANADLVFTGEHPIYNYADSSDRNLIAGAIASEKWSREFFVKLQELSQTHLEQTGNLKGTLVLDGKKYTFDFRAMKDHTFGSRTWLTWDRHYWISGLADNGYQWTVTTIRYLFLGRLSAGFVIDPEGRVDAIVDCTDLEAISKEKLLPDQGTLEIKMRSGKTHRIEFRRNGHFPYLMDGKYMMREAIGTYKFDGTDGLGMVEFGFHADRYTL
ncbi:MAG TPA: hypothetical protein VMC08_06775 [Bacteroidales bacterium]|nr:hypothetical protein [Bacteroidales bacterium]